MNNNIKSYSNEALELSIEMELWADSFSILEERIRAITNSSLFGAVDAMLDANYRERCDLKDYILEKDYVEDERDPDLSMYEVLRTNSDIRTMELRRMAREM